MIYEYQSLISGKVPKRTKTSFRIKIKKPFPKSERALKIWFDLYKLYRLNGFHNFLAFFNGFKI